MTAPSPLGGAKRSGGGGLAHLVAIEGVEPQLGVAHAPRHLALDALPLEVVEDLGLVAALPVLRDVARGDRDGPAQLGELRLFGLEPLLPARALDALGLQVVAVRAPVQGGSATGPRRAVRGAP
ncbi:hypothetical protein M768_11075 [Cellulosimicrobium cellulans F16]|uniref:Uncharacterized protein n=1 Tax=Cellulosimicrobium cellulans F16 TaxID=1350482 RepID=A0A0M0F8I0_CELCE|nr:hypothetical protein M768_11075 [Cellulosimicrobium cellulans F16]